MAKSIEEIFSGIGWATITDPTNPRGCGAGEAKAKGRAGRGGGVAAKIEITPNTIASMWAECALQGPGLLQDCMAMCEKKKYLVGLVGEMKKSVNVMDEMQGSFRKLATEDDLEDAKLQGVVGKFNAVLSDAKDYVTTSDNNFGVEKRKFPKEPVQETLAKVAWAIHVLLRCWAKSSVLEPSCASD